MTYKFLTSFTFKPLLVCYGLTEKFSVFLFYRFERWYCNPKVCVETKAKRCCHHCAFSQPMLPMLLKNLLFRLTQTYDTTSRRDKFLPFSPECPKGGIPFPLKERGFSRPIAKQLSSSLPVL